MLRPYSGLLECSLDLLRHSGHCRHITTSRTLDTRTWARLWNTPSILTKMHHAPAGTTRPSIGSSIRGCQIDSRTSSPGLGNPMHWFPSNIKCKSSTSNIGDIKPKSAATSAPLRTLLRPEPTSWGSSDINARNRNLASQSINCDLINWYPAIFCWCIRDCECVSRCVTQHIWFAFLRSNLMVVPVFNEFVELKLKDLRPQPVE